MTDDRLAPLFTWRSAICESELHPTTRHVALTLSLHMNERGGSAYPGAPRLARETGLHVSTIRERLHELVDAGWLTLLEEGGLKGRRRSSNVYGARVPHDGDSTSATPDGEPDPSPTPTRRTNRGDPSSSPRRPVGQDDPISSGVLQEIPPGGADTIVAAYITDFAALHAGQQPSRRWRAIAGRMAREALDDGAQPADITAAFAAIARENRAPTVLAHVLADLYAERSRHQGTDSFFDELEIAR